MAARMTTRSGKNYQAPLVVATTEPIIITSAHQDTSAVTANNVTSMWNPHELSELTTLPKETTEPCNEDSVAPTCASISESSTSPPSRVEGALLIPSLQIKVEEVDITFLEDAFTAPEDALNNEDALRGSQSSSRACEFPPTGAC